VDYLSLKYGLKFEIPFQVLVVFATNLKPSELADEAFLRRIHNKIRIDAISTETFDEIFRRVARARKVTMAPESFENLRRLVLAGGRTELRACYPIDVCNILNSIASYEAREATADLADLKRAVDLYFTTE
jgi:hypothetical protein